MVPNNIHIRGRLPFTGNRPKAGSGSRQAVRPRAYRGTALLAVCILLLALAFIPGPAAATQDLRVTFVQANVGGATAGTVFTHSINPVRTTVKNNGTETSPAAVLLLTSSDGFSSTKAIPAIASGGTAYVTINDTTIRGDSAGTIAYTATADPDNLISESVETNNAYTKSNLPVTFNGYKGKALYSSNGGNVSTIRTYDLHGGVVHSFGNSYYRSGSFSDGWTDYDVQWGYNAANVSSPPSFELVVPASATVREVRLFLPYTWDYPDATRGRNMPDNVTVTFNGNVIHYETYYWDQGNFGEWGDYRYGLLAYNVTSLYQKNATNTLHFTRGGYTDKLSLYGMTLMVVYENPAESRKQIFINEEFDLLGADPTNYKTVESEATAYVPFTGMAIDTAAAKSAELITFVPSGDSGEGNLSVNNQLVASYVWNYGAGGQPVGENGYPQVAVDRRNVLGFLNSGGNVIGIASNAWNSSPCMAAVQQVLMVDYYSAPVAAFAADTVSGTAPLSVTFTDQSANAPASWSWDFGDGSASTLQNPVHQYTTAGTYTVTLTATNPGGSDSETKSGYITVTSSGATPVALPGQSGLPTDPDSDGLYEDLNANGRIDGADYQLYFLQMDWMTENEPIALFDFNGNSRIDGSDYQILFGEL